MPSLSKAKLLTSPGERVRGIKEFVYRKVEESRQGGGRSLGQLPPNAETLWSEPPIQDSLPESEKKYTDEDLNAREQEGWQKGFQEATARDRENLEKKVAMERQGLAAALNEFVQEKEEYFRNVEGEVVRLVLAVVRKVLHREAQVDPLLLTGVVRVALEKITSSTSLKLLVPTSQAQDWRVALMSLTDRDSNIKIVGDESLKGPQCLIVTEAGITDVSLEGQLAEIERGFLDLLSERPGESSKELRPPSYAA